MDDVVDSRVFISAPAKKMQRRLDDLFPQPRFLSLAQPGDWFFPMGGMAVAFFCGLVVVGPPGSCRTPSGSLCTAHNFVPSGVMHRQSRGLYFDSRPNIIVTNVNLQASRSWALRRTGCDCN